MRAALTIAGSDSGGGAGIQADLNTFAAFGLHGTSAITAITCQNTKRVGSIHPVPPQIVREQLLTILEDIPIAAAKTGMLHSAPIIRCVEEVWSDPAIAGAIPLIVDPVMRSTSNNRLLLEESLSALISLMQMAALVTPNLPECETLLGGGEIKTLRDMERGVVELHTRIKRPILLKGGHRKGDSERPDEAIDLFFDGERLELITQPFHHCGELHGTGCTLSAAIAAGLANGESLFDAILAAREYLSEAIRASFRAGEGSRLLGKGKPPDAAQS